MAGLARRGLVVGRLWPRLLRTPVSLTPRPALYRLPIRLLSAAPRVSEPLAEEVVGLNLSEEEVERRRGGTGWQELLDKKLYKIDTEVRRVGRASQWDLEDVMNTVDKGKLCSPNQALLVLRCCGSVQVDLAPEERTRLLAEYLAVLGRVPDLAFDVSHYNAILKVHLENGSSVSASEFLGDMEAAGISPNRVTFQHLVGLYCQAGNIAGATTVLEHMKEQEMAINEAVFLSLLTGHCLKLDHASVASTLEVMAASGLLLGPETYAVVAASYGRAGAWDKVEEALAQAKEAEQAAAGAAWPRRPAPPSPRSSPGSTDTSRSSGTCCRS